MRTLPALAVATLVLLAAPSPASAQQAIALFTQGRGLVEAGRWAEACPLFEEAHRLEKTALGIAINLAECYEKIGKTASAWSTFRESEFLAKKAGEDGKATYAHEHATALEPRLSRLRIDADATPGLVVHRDDQEVGKAILGTTFPVDPGPHKIEATAPGYLVWTTTLVVGPERDMKTVTVPTLGKAPVGAGPDAGAGAPARAFVWTGQRVAGMAVGSVGVAGVIVGGALGGVAMAKYGESKSSCLPAQPDLCYSAGVALRQSAHRFADGSTGALVAGGVLAAVGVVVFATGAPKAGATTGGVRKVELLPLAARGTAGLGLGGAW